jgi:fimbrial chaperone protein
MRALGALWAIVLTTVAWAGTTHAGSLRVGPTLIALDAEHPVAVVRVTNNNAVTTAIDVRANAWQQSANQDAYSDTQQLIVTPPVFDLKAGETQTVRIGLSPSAKLGSQQAERAFRVFVAELPDQQHAPTQTQMLMRVGIPVFVGDATALPEVTWQLTQPAAGTWRLEATNRGSAHARLVRVELQAAGAPATDELKGAYILPGATRTWMLPAHADVSQLAEVELRAAYRVGNDQTTKLVPQSAGSAALASSPAR